MKLHKIILAIEDLGEQYETSKAKNGHKCHASLTTNLNDHICLTPKGAKNLRLHLARYELCKLAQ